jgi:hypothetical protein
LTGGNEGIRQSLATMCGDPGPADASRGMVDPELIQYACRALDALIGAG